MQVQVRSYLDRREVFLGERFIYQIRVRGGDSIGNPDFSYLSSLFDVHPIDKRYARYYLRNSADLEPEKDEKIYYYRFIALHTGKLEIGSIPIEIDGKNYLTQAHAIIVNEPEESAFFKLSLNLSKDQAYEGEPVVLTVVWYYRDTVTYYNFLFPILNHPDILAGEYVDENINDSLLLPFGSGRVPIERGIAPLDGIIYDTITYRQYLIPQKTGYFQFPRGTVQLWKPREGYSSNSSNYETMVVASQGITFQVLPLPERDRPAQFTGLVGEDFSITTSASPVEVNVGDPITLTISLSGTSSVENAKLPLLKELTVFKKQFAFVSHRSAERMEGKSRIFTRVIRARSHEVLEVPPVEIAYFNTQSRSYEIATSDPIPLMVRSTRVVMEDDLEGESSRNRMGHIIASKEGINFNYEGASLLVQDQHDTLSSLLRDPLLLVLLVVPPLGFLALLVLEWLKPGRPARNHAKRQRKVFRLLMKSARRYGVEGGTVKGQILVDRCMEFLGLKLGFPANALTYGDVEREIRNRMIDTDILPELEALFSFHDRNRYAGKIWTEKTGEQFKAEAKRLLSLVLKISREIERKIPL